MKSTLVELHFNKTGQAYMDSRGTYRGASKNGYISHQVLVCSVSLTKRTKKRRKVHVRKKKACLFHSYTCNLAFFGKSFILKLQNYGIPIVW